MEARLRQEALLNEAREEMRKQAKIQSMGKCVQGFPWTKIPGGYVCGGGSHIISDQQLL
jgi:hypothetical protein